MIYDASHYSGAHYGWSAEHDWPHLVRAAAGVVALLGQPVSHIDIGCGCGAVVWFMDQISNSTGVELNTEALVAEGIQFHPELLLLFLHEADLRQPLDVGKRVDLVTCWEVAEHLPESAAETIAASCARHVSAGGHLVWTAAHPGQDGTGHVNCQPKRYWIDLLTAQGLEYLDQETRFLAVVWDHTVNPLLHLRDNVVVMRRPE